MKGVIVNYRSSPHCQTDSHMVILPSGASTRKKSEVLVGKAVEFTTQTGKKIMGKIAAVHVNKGAVRVIFEKGMPGQSLGKEVKIV